MLAAETIVDNSRGGADEGLRQDLKNQRQRHRPGASGELEKQVIDGERIKPVADFAHHLGAPHAAEISIAGEQTRVRPQRNWANFQLRSRFHKEKAEFYRNWRRPRYTSQKFVRGQLSQLSVGNQFQKILVNAAIVAQFRMEGGGKCFSLADEHRVIALGRDHFHARADMRNLWRTDEDHLNRDGSGSALANRAVDLASVGVAANGMSIAPRPACAGFSTSLANRIAPAQVPKVGFGRTNSFSFANPSSPSNFRNVPDSPPGMTSPSILVELLGLLDEHNFCAQLFEPVRCASKSPCSARTPMVIALDRSIVVTSVHARTRGHNGASA